MNGQGDIQSFRHVYWGNRLFLFKDPIEVTITRNGRLWVLQCKPLEILCYDDTFKKTVEQFYEEIAVLWDEFVENEEQNLAPDGLRLRNELIRWIEKVVCL